MEILREAEAQRLRVELTGPAPALTLVSGPSGSGKAGLVRRAVRGLEVVRYWAAPLPDADHRALLLERLGRWAEGGALPRPAGWPEIFEHLLGRAAERAGTLRLVLEELPRLLETHPRLASELERFWAGVRARGLPVHLVLVASDDPTFGGLLTGESPLGGWSGHHLTVPPLSYREVGALFRSYPPRERLLAWTVFGGLARHLSPCEADVTLATNVRQAILAPDGSLFREGAERLQRSLQSVPRYASVLRSLSEGRREWRAVLAGTPDLASGGQMAPYLARLQQLGLVAAEASLDAPPGSRSRRYRVVDPFLGFWHRFVLPHLSDLLDGHAQEVWRQRIRPHLDEHAGRLFPLACREYLARYAGERLPGAAREVGGLWGHDYDMELAGTLRTGAAFYGRSHWGGARVPEAADEALQEEVRRTRYGFGREARLRLHFSAGGFAPALLRRGARSEVMHLIGLDDLLPD